MTPTHVVSELMLPFEPSREDPFDLRKVGHLVRRVAFGASLAERQRMVALGPDAAVARACAKASGEDVDAAMADAIAIDQIETARAYRIWRMLHGRQRLSERLSLFWHGHFAVSNVKVDSVRMMMRQQAMFDALGQKRFDDLVQAISRDPAMLRWLDNDSNVKGRPNENLARELFELFTLGRGNYTEQDIKEAARAFTGWGVRSEQFSFRRTVHDAGIKTVFGKSGRFDGADVIKMAVARPASTRFICGKLLAFFVHPRPTAAEIDAVAAIYDGSGRDLGATLRVLLASRLFFSARAYRSRIKSPIDLVVGLVRSLGARAAPRDLARECGRLGQTLLEPPTVEGWHEERAWISPASWLLRSNLAGALFSGRFRCRPDADALLAPFKDPAEKAAVAIRILLDDDIADEARRRVEALARSEACRGAGGAALLMQAVQSLPEAQLL